MDQPAQPDRTYDLYFAAGKQRFRWRNDDHGVTLGTDRLSWTAGGRPDYAPFDNIAAVRLQSGGDWKNAMNTCEVRFRDGYMIRITDGSDYGTTDNSRTPVYRDFVRALHARLLGRPVTFSAGYTQGQYRVVYGAALVLGAMALLGPLVLLVYAPPLKVIGLLVGGAFLCWPLYKMVNNNVPRSYDPRWPPAELME